MTAELPTRQDYGIKPVTVRPISLDDVTDCLIGESDYAEMAETFALQDVKRYAPKLADLIRKVIHTVNHPAFVREWGDDLAKSAAPFEPWFGEDAQDEAQQGEESDDVPF